MTPLWLSGSRLAVGTATCGTVLIAAAAFWLSFTALSGLAGRSGVGRGQAWAWPLIVDGLIVVSTVAVVALDGSRAAWYPWLLLAAATAVSVAGNAVHAAVGADADVPGPLAAFVAAVPPLVLLASTHLTVVLVRSSRAADHPVGTGPDAPASPAGAETPAPSEARADGPVPDGRRALAANLRTQGWSNKSIARHLGVAPSTVGRWFAAATPPAAPDRRDNAEEPHA